MNYFVGVALSLCSNLCNHYVALKQSHNQYVTQDANRINVTANLYADLLTDLDALVSTDQGFLLGSWIEMARKLGNGTDCTVPDYGIDNCPDFMEWNARVQLTTWNPTPIGASGIPGGPVREIVVACAYQCAHPHIKIAPSPVALFVDTFAWQSFAAQCVDVARAPRVVMMLEIFSPHTHFHVTDQ